MKVFSVASVKLLKTALQGISPAVSFNKKDLKEVSVNFFSLQYLILFAVTLFSSIELQL